MSNTDENKAPAATEPIGERRLVSAFTDGGHEIDRPPAATLFGLLIAMGVLIIGSAFGVYQLFVGQADEDAAQTASEPVMRQVNQAARDREYLTTYGVVSVDGKPAGYRMPIETAKAMVLHDPSRFAPAAPPAGWVHPDDAAKPAPPPPEKE